MDSAATMEIPLTGYGIRYSNGLFSQYIEDGEQKEIGDFGLNMEILGASEKTAIQLL